MFSNEIPFHGHHTDPELDSEADACGMLLVKKGFQYVEFIVVSGFHAIKFLLQVSGLQQVREKHQHQELGTDALVRLCSGQGLDEMCVTLLCEGKQTFPGMVPPCLKTAFDMPLLFELFECRIDGTVARCMEVIQ